MYESKADDPRCEILDHIERLAEEGKPPTKEEFEEAESTPSVMAVMKLFGTPSGGWQKAVERAGFGNPDGVDRGLANRAELKDQLRQKAEDGVAVGPEVFNNDTDTYSLQVVRRLYPSYRDAAEAAGVEFVDRRQDYTKEELIENLHKAAHDGVAPTTREFDQRVENGPSASTIIRRFGGWRKAVEEAGLKPKRKTK